MKRWTAILGVWIGSSACTFAADAEVAIQVVGTEHPTSFPQLLQVHVTNLSYTPLNLAERMAASELQVDGRPQRHGETPFSGPPGIPAVKEWSGCLSLEEYVPDLSPGKHRASLVMGSLRSNEVTFRWFQPVEWRKGTLKTRLKEVRRLAAALQDGLPRSCVERWLTLPEGTTQDGRAVRYYLEPQIRVIVPYSGSEILGVEVVSGPVQVYQEASLPENVVTHP